MQQFVSRFFNLLVQLLHLYLSSPVPANASFLSSMHSIQLQTKRYCPIYFSFPCYLSILYKKKQKNYFILPTLPLMATTEYYIYIIVHCSCVVCYSDRLSYHGGEKKSIVSRSNSFSRLENRIGNDDKVLSLLFVDSN